MYVLGIESTCDETAAAIVEDGRKVISNVISTSVKEQALYGGVVPEIASRRHAEYISATVDKALADANMTMKDVDAVAVTFAPGLIGAVLVGVNFAKGLAYAAGKPLVPVHHLRGHIAANYLTHQSLHPPFLCLVASGGHSHIVMVEDWCRYKVLGRTVDDAAGEAYDKVARTLGLPYPGGPSVAAAARDGDPHAYKLPVPHVEGKYNVSFSGLKTAVINEVHNAEQKGQPVNVADMAASFQERIDQILAKKLLSAAADTGAKRYHDHIFFSGSASFPHFTESGNIRIVSDVRFQTCQLFHFLFHFFIFPSEICAPVYNSFCRHRRRNSDSDPEDVFFG